jgi:hypothetical protein
MTCFARGAKCGPIAPAVAGRASSASSADRVAAGGEKPAPRQVQAELVER